MKKPILQKAAAEFIGTYAMVFAGCGAIAVADRFPGSIPNGAVPIVFGLSVATMIYSVGHISGAHFNPAVTLAFAVARHFSVREVLPYWIAQFSGAFAAVTTLSLLLPSGSTFGATVPHATPIQALGWEFVLSFFLMFVIVSVATDARAVGTMAGTAIGSVVTLNAFIGGAVSGASMNPARTLAPAFFENTFAHLWIYFVGPFAGAVLAALVYGVIKCNTSRANSAKGCC